MPIRFADHGQRGPCWATPAHELICSKAVLKVPRGFRAQQEQEEDSLTSAGSCASLHTFHIHGMPQESSRSGSTVGSCTEGSLHWGFKPESHRKSKVVQYESVVCKYPSQNQGWVWESSPGGEEQQEGAGSLSQESHGKSWSLFWKCRGLSQGCPVLLPAFFQWFSCCFYQTYPTVNKTEAGLGGYAKSPNCFCLNLKLSVLKNDVFLHSCWLLGGILAFALFRKSLFIM